MTGLQNVELTLVDNIDKALDLKSWLGERRPDQILGFDTETHGLDLYAPHAKLRMVQIGDGSKGWAIPWERWGGVAIEVLDLWQGRFTAHNLSFDYKAMLKLANYRLPWERFDDTMLMAQIDTPGGQAGLKFLTDKFIDPRASQGADALKRAFKNNGWTWATIPVDYEDYWVYSALDPVLAVKLHEHFKFIPEKFSAVYDMEFAVRRVCTEMEHTGMRIDLDYVQTKYNELGTKISEAKAWAEDNWGVNVASGQQMVEFFTKLGAPFSVFTGKGAPSVNADQLKIFSESPISEIAETAKFVLDIRKTEKINSSYFENFLKMNEDGILHPEIKTMGARTGRMSITSPALQTLPSSDSLVRGAFISRNEGETLISCDYSQMELRLLAHYSNDPSLIEAFYRADNEEGGDFFNEIGKGVYHTEDFDRDIPEYKKRGKALKTLMYGIIYGASVPSLSKQAEIPLDEMEETYNGLVTTFPGIKEFMDSTISEGEDRLHAEGVGYAVLDSGRVLPTENRDLYKLTNYRLQGAGAEVTKTALLRLASAGLGPNLQVPVHDEVIFSVPDEEVEYWMPIIEECMSFTNGEFHVPMPAEPEILGTRWGDGDKYA